GKQVRYVKGGESYGIFNSFQQHFGLGEHNAIDSMVIKWPSGQLDRYSGLESNRTYFAQEGKCVTAAIELYSDIQYFTSQPVQLFASDSMLSYKWNNGDTNQAIQIEEEGTFHVRMTDAIGCVTISKPMVVRSGCFSANTKLINEDPEVSLCDGQTLEISAVPAETYQWSDGSTEQSRTFNTTQYVSLTAIDFCGNLKTDQLYVKFLNVDIQVKNDTIKKGEKATLVSDNKNTSWYTGNDKLIPYFIGDTLVTEILDNTTIFYAGLSEVIDQKKGRLGQVDFPITNLYGANSTEGHLVFDVHSPGIIHSVKVNTDTEGQRRIIIRNDNDDIIFSKDVFLSTGIQSVVLDAHLNPGQSYKMATDIEVNNASLGFKSPRLVRTFNTTSYPYFIEDVISIQSSSFGAIYYYYFYDWEVFYDIKTCESDLKEVIAFIDTSSGITETNIKNPFVIYPNPALDYITVKMEDGHVIESISIKNLHGQQIWHDVYITDTVIDIHTLTSGMYIIDIQANNAKYYVKLLKE
ncbi:MAG: ASPIC/UnbV domain-containing protein, partial [Saprospiraceae bacterium]|nr:ASPIC/UnbV domain-containing protein [Saprospiraceae bacterium]